MEQIYNDLKKEKEDYLFSGENAERLYILYQELPDEKDQLFSYLGGPILWISKYFGIKKEDKRRGISKLERKIIRSLKEYELVYKNGYCFLNKKENHPS